MDIYLIKTKHNNHYKIGVSKNPKKRITELQTGNSEELELIFQFKSKSPYILEKALHRTFSYLRENGEWFALSSADVESFINICTKTERNISLLKNNGNIFL